MNEDQTSRPADWTTVVLQAIFGLIAGVVLSFSIVTRFYEPWIALVLAPGLGLMGAGLAAHRGDRLWFAISSTVEGDLPRHNMASKVFSWTLLGIGCVALILAVVWIARLPSLIQ